jgi:mevalonate kinase
MYKTKRKSIFPGFGDYSSGTFHSRGKLLLTGEYLVLRGADALALPLKFGQKLKWQGWTKGPTLEWNTRVQGRRWFNAVFRGPDYSVVSTSDRAKARFLGEILLKASQLSVQGPVSGRVESSVDFDVRWGLGSSSSLISNVAYLFDINPFELHFSVSGGSGYDIACARADSPLMYKLRYQSEKYHAYSANSYNTGIFSMPVYRHVNFNPLFKNSLFFAWTGRKQDSSESVEDFLSTVRSKDTDILNISRISQEVLNSKTIDEFKNLMKEHDHIISGVLGKKPVSETDFREFPGYVKSLGAWGGDFIMITWEGSVIELKHLLQQKGIDTLFSYDKLIMA